MKIFHNDLILLHAPSVYDFRQKSILYGPISDVVPSTQIFEMYPIGFMTLLAYLQQHGYSARIINVALLMLWFPWLDVEKLIRSLRPAAFGIDLHWLVHAQGSLALAEIIKRYHPDIPVIFGGLSASYYHTELIAYPQVDYVLRGESTEEPLRQLLAALKDHRALHDVPNLTWKEHGAPRVNDLSYSPATLDDMRFDYAAVMKSTLHSLDVCGHLPFKSWPSYPILTALSCRGCTHNCVICGGSAAAYQRTSQRHTVAFRSPEDLAQDIHRAARYINAPIIVLGDLQQAGEDYIARFLNSLRHPPLRNHLAVECFRPASRQFLAQLVAAAPKVNLQISPESHDEAIRTRFGRLYTNAELEEMLAAALEVGLQRVDVFFMIGLPMQTAQSVQETVNYCRTLLERFGRQRRGWLHPYIAPLAPFLDPGSRAFEEPERYGYKLTFRTLEAHRQALTAPAWKYVLNYETEWMTRDEIVDSTYSATLELNRLKGEYGLQNRKMTARIEQRIGAERDIMRQIDEILANHTESDQQALIDALFRRQKFIGLRALTNKNEMNWPTHLLRFNASGIARELLTMEFLGDYARRIITTWQHTFKLTKSEN